MPLDNTPAFPLNSPSGTPEYMPQRDGMSLRDYFAGQALANCALCTGEARDWQIKAWFGERGGITREEIVAKQAYALADAMLKAREVKS